MKKITDIKVTRYRTVEEKDASGKRVRRQVPYSAPFEVNQVSDGKRLAHYFIDGLAAQMISALVQLVFELIIPHNISPGSSMAIGLFGLNSLFLLLYPAYYIVCEYYLGQTLGKLATSSRVIGIYGKNLSFETILTRSIVRLVPFEPLSFFGGRGWHDKWSDTWVVSKTEADRIQALLDEENAKAA